jgi:hypothetical protein
VEVGKCRLRLAACGPRRRAESTGMTGPTSHDEHRGIQLVAVVIVVYTSPSLVSVWKHRSSPLCLVIDDEKGSFFVANWQRGPGHYSTS